MAQKNLLLPALKAHMGDWVYYVTFLKMSDIAVRVEIAQDIHPGKTLNELIQRGLKNRAPQIRDYLLTQPQRFFNTLVIGVYGGKPEWLEVGIKDNNVIDVDDLPTDIDGALGFLQLTGAETLFALDGQHRVEGIKLAVKMDPSLGSEEVSAIFVGHKNDSAGLARTRRLFTTLNRHAKPVSKKDSVALDEDDVVAIVTRRLIDEHPLFHDKISLAETKSLSVSDARNFTSVVALYDAMDIYLKPSGRKWLDFKKRRPSDKEIDDYYNKAKELWDLLLNQFDWLKDYSERTPADGIAAKYRNETGGYLLFRPIGILIIVRVLKSLTLSGNTIADSIKSISGIPMLLSHKPWNGLLWDGVNKRMITAPVNQAASEKIVFYSVGGDLVHRYKLSPEKLKQQLAGILNKPEDKVELPKY